MTLRQKLLNSDDPSGLIWNLDPQTITAKDLKTLLLIKKARPSDRLGHLGLEAEWWIKDNIKILKERFTQ